uniref:Uncharacterized protein n=1 Tax=Strongyloides venezuelensis TaxID=75913 RepID=A0A0K0G668_STRVS
MICSGIPEKFVYPKGRNKYSRIAKKLYRSVIFVTCGATTGWLEGLKSVSISTNIASIYFRCINILKHVLGTLTRFLEINISCFNAAFVDSPLSQLQLFGSPNDFIINL